MSVPPVRQSENGAERILTIVQDLGPGGTQRSAENNAISYLNAGRASAVLARFKGGDRTQRIIDAGVPVFLPTTDLGETDPQLVQQIADWNPSVIQFHRHGHSEPSCGNLLRAIAEKLGHRVPTAELSHFGRCDRTDDRHLFDIHMQLSIACLKRYRNWARGLKPQPVSITVPHMIDTDRFYAATAEEANQFRGEHGIPQDAFVYVRVGQPIPSKWTAGVVHAFAEVAKKEPNSYLVLVGLPKNVRAAAESQDPDIRKRIIMIDFLNGDPALRACYTASDLFVHTATVGETFGLVLAESMACGTPCLTISTPTRDNSQGSVVGHKDAGIVLANETLLAQYMLMLANDPDQLGDLAKRARPRVLELFHQDTVIPDALFALDATVMHAGDPSALRNAIGNRPRLMPQESALRAPESMIGNHTLKDRIVAAAKETPLVYQAYTALKQRRSRHKS
ncbi:MAG: glycosyltransferase family 4 protein [Phycisphaerales bacterium]|nr:glycosyltransferase family 4 protein [Phycisphaerales bacterium]